MSQDIVIFLLQDLGFVINLQKSKLEQNTKLEFLGMIFWAKFILTCLSNLRSPAQLDENGRNKERRTQQNFEGNSRVLNSPKYRNNKKSNLSNCQFEHNFLYKSIYTIYIDVKISWHLIGRSNFHLTDKWGKQGTN